MPLIYVLRHDWEVGKDPVPYYGEHPDRCLDFNNRRAKPRALLTFVEVAGIGDCEHGIEYEVVICEAPDVQ